MVTPLTLKLAGSAGLASAAILAVNTLKRGGVIPTAPVTQLLAPLAQVFAILLILGMYAALRDRRHSSALAAAASIGTLALLVGVEFALNLVFPYVSTAVVTTLRQGPLGTALTVASMLFLVTAVATAVILGRHAGSPRLSLGAYAMGAAVVALRAFVPAVLLVAGLGIMTIGVAGMAMWLLTRAEPAPTVTGAS